MTPSSHIPHTQTLSATRRGETVRLVQIEAGRRLTHRLAELGLTPGVTLHVVHKNGGPMLVAVRGTRLALGRGVAEKIQVVPVSVPPSNGRRAYTDLNHGAPESAEKVISDQ